MWSLVTSMKLLMVTRCRHSFLEYFHQPQANSDGVLMKGKGSETISVLQNLTIILKIYIMLPIMSYEKEGNVSSSNQKHISINSRGNIRLFRIYTKWYYNIIVNSHSKNVKPNDVQKYYHIILLVKTLFYLTGLWYFCYHFFKFVVFNSFLC